MTDLGTNQALSHLMKLAKYVEDNEPGCLRYEIVKQKNGDDGQQDIVMVERYATLIARFDSFTIPFTKAREADESFGMCGTGTRMRRHTRHIRAVRSLGN